MEKRRHTGDPRHMAEVPAITTHRPISKFGRKLTPPGSRKGFNTHAPGTGDATTTHRFGLVASRASSMAGRLWQFALARVRERRPARIERIHYQPVDRPIHEANPLLGLSGDSPSLRKNWLHPHLRQ